MPQHCTATSSVSCALPFGYARHISCRFCAHISVVRFARPTPNGSICKSTYFAVEASDCLLITRRGTKLPEQSKQWLKKYGAKHKTISKAEIQRLAAKSAHGSVHEELGTSESSVHPPPLRPCQQASHFADGILALHRLRRVNAPSA